MFTATIGLSRVGQRLEIIMCESAGVQYFAASDTIDFVTRSLERHVHANTLNHLRRHWRKLRDRIDEAEARGEVFYLGPGGVMCLEGEHFVYA